jgi:hypothetical protein
VAATAGNYDRARELGKCAEQAVPSINLPDYEAHALAYLAGAVAAIGDRDRAEKIARSVTKPDQQARALASVASTADPMRARSCIASALAVGRWSIPLNASAHTDPRALLTFADERLASLRATAKPTG